MSAKSALISVKRGRKRPHNAERDSRGPSPAMTGGGDSGRSDNGLAGAVAGAGHVEAVGAVGQPVEQRAGQTLAAENLGPLAGRAVADDDGGAAFAAPAEHLEQQ